MGRAALTGCVTIDINLNTTIVRKSGYVFLNILVKYVKKAAKCFLVWNLTYDIRTSKPEFRSMAGLNGLTGRCLSLDMRKHAIVKKFLTVRKPQAAVLACCSKPFMAST